MGNVGDSLQRKLIVAIAERGCQLDAFQSVSETIERDVKQEWVKMVDDWEADESKPNPYMLLRKGIHPVFHVLILY